MLRRLEPKDMDAAALVLRTAFDHALPSLAGLHTPQEDLWFLRERVLITCEVWGAIDGAGMIGMIACRFGRSSATCGLDAFTKQEALRWSGKRTTQEMKRRSRMRSISGPADGPTAGSIGKVRCWSSDVSTG
jgi:hypothetical protein